ncbi:MAG: AAA family ATPase [Clostridia bacterium]|nr:AAA family ATPase [Clostridia bacterium]
MKINKLQINGFGNIENKELELSEGINLIYGKNESGKSTIASFIKCVFYGINKNKSGNEFSEFELRKPWKNIEFSGKIEYELDGKKYTAFRDFNKNNCKVYDENGTDITTDFPKDKARGTEVGFHHLGIDEETFINTLFVSQDNSTVDIQSQKSVIQKLTNILQSGQESVSFEKIKSKLQKKVLEEIGTDRTHNKPINVIKRDIADKEQTIVRLLGNRNRKEVLDDRQNDIKEQIAKIENNIEQINKVLDVKQKYATLLEEKERTYELTVKIKAKERQDKIENNKKQFKNAIIFLIALTIIICFVLAYFKFYIWIVAELLLAILGGVILNLTNKIILPEEDDTDFNVTKEELNKKEAKELEKLHQKGVKETYIQRKAFELKNLLDGLEKNKNDLILENHKIKLEEESLKENIERLTDVEEQLADLKTKRDELLIKSKVINIAIQKLEEAYEELKMEVIPELQRNIKNKIKETTDGKYIDAIYNNEEGIIVENLVGELVPISKLSMGTIDQMYLGFRFGISEKMGDIPIILDESFAYYDNERLENFIGSLKNSHKQIIILTCSNREKEILNKLKMNYKYLEV